MDDFELIILSHSPTSQGGCEGKRERMGTTHASLGPTEEKEGGHGQKQTTVTWKTEHAGMYTATHLALLHENPPSSRDSQKTLTSQKILSLHFPCFSPSKGH